MCVIDVMDAQELNVVKRLAQQVSCSAVVLSTLLIVQNFFARYFITIAKFIIIDIELYADACILHI